VKLGLHTRAGAKYLEARTVYRKSDHAIRVGTQVHRQLQLKPAA
jgi:hypothetical protein